MNGLNLWQMWVNIFFMYGAYVFCCNLILVMSNSQALEATRNPPHFFYVLRGFYAREFMDIVGK